MKHRFVLVATALIALAGATALAQQAFVPAQSGVRSREPYRPIGKSGNTRIIGTVIDIRQVPVKYARLQLRDLTTGAIDQQGLSNDNGEYEFNVLEPGSYVVEMVMVDGYVVALSNAGALGRFETMVTVLQLPGRWDSGRVLMDQNLSNYFGLSAQTSMTAGTLEFAVDQNIAPADSGVPVSPNR